MIEMRWVYYDLKDGPPPAGSICVGDRLYQKLQYRNGDQKVTSVKDGNFYILHGNEWKDVPLVRD